MATGEKAEIAIIGGTGVYDPEILEDLKEVKIYTPYGSTSDLITLGSFGGRNIAFLPRHGRGHRIPPHAVNYKANIWALKTLGVEQIIASNAVGSLREDYKPGEFVVPEQFVDRTRKRKDTFYEGGRLCHISAADPICPELHDVIVNYIRKTGLQVHPKGTYVCIEGPRFSTRAESRLFRQWGCDIIGMTLYPECILAREAEICYATIAMVTDYDVWAEKPVSSDEVVKTMNQNSANFRKIIMGVIPELPKSECCGCHRALENALL